MSRNKKSSTTGTLAGIIIILLLLLLIIIALIILLRSGDPAAGQAVEPTASLEPSPTPTPTPKPTPTPTPTPTPIPSEEPGGQPDDEPAPSADPPAAATSGSFSSDTGTSLNTKLSWKAAKTDDGKVQLEVSLLLESGRLTMMPQNSGAVLTIGEESFTCYTPAIEKEDGELSQSLLCSKTVTLPYISGMSVTISSSFHYGGSYGKTQINDITAGGIAVIS